MEYQYLSHYDDSSFKMAFCQYFQELGISLSPDNDVFLEMGKEGKKKLKTLLVLEGKEIIGFAMYQEDGLTNWFFVEKIGFIREFWIKKDQRKKRIGSSLLQMVLIDLKKKGVRKILLTTDMAAVFYEKNGFSEDKSYSAKNEDPVYFCLL